MVKTFFRSLKTVYKCSASLFILNIFTVVISGFLTGLNIYSIQSLVNGIQSSISDGTGIWRSLMLFLCINVSLVLMQNMRGYLGQRLAVILDFNLDNDFLGKCTTLPLKDFENEKTYDLIIKANELGKAKILDMFFNFIQLIECILSIISVSAVMIRLDSILWILIIIVPLLSAIASIKVGRYVYNKERENVIYQRKSDYLNYLLTNNIAIKEIISFNVGDYIRKEYRQYKEIIKNTNCKIINIQVIKNSVIAILEIITKIFLVIVIVIKTIKGSGLIGDVMGFIYSLDVIEAKINIILTNMTEIYKNKLYVDNYFEFIDKEVETDNICIEENKLNVEKIVIKDLSFSYNNGNAKELEDINLEIDKSNIIAIVGSNGAGKSTLIKILSGLYDDYQGKIFINGVNLKNMNKKNYRERLTIIFQDFNKYELSLRENVAFSDINELDKLKKIERVLCDVGLGHLITDLEDGIESQMGNWFGGRELSKGQWQRIALSRVLFRDADVVILDEPTSALDPQTEREIFDKINEISKDKILILITHRIENLKKYNPYYVFMDHGKISEQGLFEKIKDKDVYKKLIGR